MGLASAAGAFRNPMKLLFAGVSYDMPLVYLDAVIVFVRNFYEQQEQLKLIFNV